MLICSRHSAATRKHIMVGQKYFKGKQTFFFGGEGEYTKYKKLNSNSENFKGGEIAARGDFAPLAHTSCGPVSPAHVFSDHGYFKLQMPVKMREWRREHISIAYRSVARVGHLEPEKNYFAPPTTKDTEFKLKNNRKSVKKIVKA